MRALAAEAVGSFWLFGMLLLGCGGCAREVIEINFWASKCVDVFDHSPFYCAPPNTPSTKTEWQRLIRLTLPAAAEVSSLNAVWSRVGFCDAGCGWDMLVASSRPGKGMSSHNG
ncbi:hypothetical protein IWZ01DRAFT_36710 [Phyllosticta capitalensis]